MKKRFACSCYALILVSLLHGQTPDIIKIRSYREANEKAIIDEFVSFLSIPNIAADPINLQKNADFIMEMMKKGVLGMSSC